MSFSWWLHDKDGTDLLSKYGIHYQMLGLSANCVGENGGEPNRVLDLRQAWIAVLFKDKLAEAAQSGLEAVQGLLRQNLSSFEHKHCETCSCSATYPQYWDMDQIKRLLSIPVAEVFRGGGGY